ncbi:MAG: 3-oxoacyl-[acyl-carrier-protein] reductase FabG [Pseudomonadota bacterium]
MHGIDRAPHAITDMAYRHSVLDLTDANQAALMSKEWLAQQAPDALIHAAGVMHAASLGDLQPEVSMHLWALHVQAITVLANCVVPAMQRQKSGRVVLIGSRVWAGMAGRSQYAATKAALVSLAKSWAAEAVRDGVTVNVVSPAATETTMLQDPARITSSPRVPPIGRLIQPDEIASLVAYLTSPQAAAITGQDIQICGGASLSS